MIAWSADRFTLFINNIIIPISMPLILWPLSCIDATSSPGSSDQTKRLSDWSGFHAFRAHKSKPTPEGVNSCKCLSVRNSQSQAASKAFSNQPTAQLQAMKSLPGWLWHLLYENLPPGSSGWRTPNHSHFGTAPCSEWRTCANKLLKILMCLIF